MEVNEWPCDLFTHVLILLQLEHVLQQSHHPTASLNTWQSLIFSDNTVNSNTLITNRSKVIGKGSPIQVLGWWLGYKPSDVLPLLSARLNYLPSHTSSLPLAGTNLYCSVTEAHFIQKHEIKMTTQNWLVACDCLLYKKNIYYALNHHFWIKYKIK